MIYKVTVNHMYKNKENRVYFVEAENKEHANQIISNLINTVEYIADIQIKKDNIKMKKILKTRKLSNGEIMNRILRGDEVSTQLFDKNDSLCRLFHAEISYYKNIIKPNVEECQKLENLNNIKDRVNTDIDKGIITL